MHGNVKDCEEDSWLDHVVKSISSIAHAEGKHHTWKIQFYVYLERANS